MESTSSHIESIYTKAKTYAETSIELYKLNAIDKTADVFSSLASRVAIGSIIGVFLLFVNIGISLYIGDLLAAPYLGFLIVSLFYLVLGIMVFIFHKSLIQRPINNLVINKLMANKHEEEKLVNDLIRKNNE